MKDILFDKYKNIYIKIHEKIYKYIFSFIKIKNFFLLKSIVNNIYIKFYFKYERKYGFQILKFKELCVFKELK